jgi:hypothetical protein
MGQVMHKLLSQVGEEILERGDSALGYSVLLYAGYMRAALDGEGEEYVNKYRELLHKYGLIDIIRWEKEVAEKRRKFRHPTYNEDSLYSA